MTISPWSVHLEARTNVPPPKFHLGKVNLEFANIVCDE